MTPQQIKIFYKFINIKYFFFKGENQNIISFSFFGDLKSVYYNGIENNLNYLDVSF